MEHTEKNNLMEHTTTDEESVALVLNKLKNNFFKLCKETQTMECLTCGKELAGVKSYNIKRHYRKTHGIDIQIGSKRKPRTTKNKKNYKQEMKMRKIYKKKLLELENCKKYKKHKELRKTDCLICGRQISSLSNWVIQRHLRLVHKIHLDIRSETLNPNESDVDNVESVKANSLSCLDERTTTDRNTFLKLCMALVAVKGVSVNLFDDHEVFKKLIAPQEQQFRTNLNSLDILKLIERSSSTLPDVINNKVKNKIIALILDLATGMYENVLNISIQYIDNFKMHYNTLAIIKLEKSIADVRDVVLNCLANYGITTNQVHFYVAEVTTKAAQDECFSEDETTKEPGSTINDAKQLFTNLTTEFREIKVIRSVIQLTVAEVLANIAFEINKCRDLVRELKSMLVGQPHDLILGNVTNWISTYKMLKSLLDNRVYLEKELPMNLKMVENQKNWDFITDIVNALTPIVKLNNQLKNEQYIFGDFYRDWLNCEIELEELLRTSFYAQSFLQYMHKYKQELLQDETFLSAIYLDPRFNFSNSVMLNEDQKHKAEAHLTKLYKIIHTQLKNKSQTLQNVGYDSVNPTLVLPSTFAESAQSILSSIKCEEETLLPTLYDSETTDMMEPTIKQEEFVENTSTTASYETAEIVEQETSTSNKVYDKLTQRIKKLNAKSTGIDKSLQSFKQKLICLLSDKPMLQLNENVLQYWMIKNKDADITKILEAAFAVPVTQVTVGRAAKCLDEGVFQHDMLLIKYNFQEISDISVKL